MIRGIKIRGNISAKHRFSIISRDQVTKYRPVVATLIILPRYQGAESRDKISPPWSPFDRTPFTDSRFSSPLLIYIRCMEMHLFLASSRIKVQFLSISFVNSTQRCTYPLYGERERERERVSTRVSSRGLKCSEHRRHVDADSRETTVQLKHGVRPQCKFALGRESWSPNYLLPVLHFHCRWEFAYRFFVLFIYFFFEELPPSLRSIIRRWFVFIVHGSCVPIFRFK